jgi:hypothetical protein
VKITGCLRQSLAIVAILVEQRHIDEKWNPRHPIFAAYPNTAQRGSILSLKVGEFLRATSHATVRTETLRQVFPFRPFTPGVP